MHYEVELMYTFGIIAYKSICIIFSFNILIMKLKPGTGQHFYSSKFTLTSKIALNKRGRHKEGGCIKELATYGLSVPLFVHFSSFPVFILPTFQLSNYKF